MIAISIIGTIGNLLIIGAIFFEKSLRCINNGWLFFINLAIIDLLITTFVLPLLIINEIMDHQFFDNGLCLVTAAVSGICCHGAAATLTAIAITRYLSIIKPLSHRNILKIEYVVLAIGLLWVFALGNSIPLMLAWARSGYDPFHRVCVCFDGTFSTHFVIGPIIIGHGLPHVLTAYCYWVIMKYMRRAARNVRKNSLASQAACLPDTSRDVSATGTGTGIQRWYSRISIHSNVSTTSNIDSWSTSEKQVLYGNIIIVCFFSICWIPYSILILMGEDAPLGLKRLFAGICLSSFAINAYVYGLISQKFRNGYRKTIKWVLGPFFGGNPQADQKGRSSTESSNSRSSSSQRKILRNFPMSPNQTSTPKNNMKKRVSFGSIQNVQTHQEHSIGSISYRSEKSGLKNFFQNLQKLSFLNSNSSNETTNETSYESENSGHSSFSTPKPAVRNSIISNTSAVSSASSSSRPRTRRLNSRLKLSNSFSRKAQLSLNVPDRRNFDKQKVVVKNSFENGRKKSPSAKRIEKVRKKGLR